MIVKFSVTVILAPSHKTIFQFLAFRQCHPQTGGFAFIHMQYRFVLMILVIDYSPLLPPSLPRPQHTHTFLFQRTAHNFSMSHKRKMIQQQRKQGINLERRPTRWNNKNLKKSEVIWWYCVMLDGLHLNITRFPLNSIIAHKPLYYFF